ncbi:type II toxin-antitoxin system RelE/ParE family toxin [Pontiellaceae bacterium B12227]|nr:type II toxin-antitoxin system RelE/ParE family toxin [Pontiellaceae bacterium B12227]
MTVEFLEEAVLELADAALWYESKQPGLGRRFKMEVESVTRAIAENPLVQRELEGGYRRINCPVFPYYLPYFIRGNTIIIAAVAHERRTPGYWEHR